jgi:thiol-disulfide isomerase/thioredoxin
MTSAPSAAASAQPPPAVPADDRRDGREVEDIGEPVSGVGEHISQDRLAVVRAPVDTIHAPPFPRGLAWVNVAMLRLDQQRGRPVLVEFFDPFRVHSLRTLPYAKAWHERYAHAGLRVISVHAPGFPPGHDEEVARAAVARLGIEHPVALDLDFIVWRLYGNEGWPARYLFNPELRLHEFHYGLGAYDETEREIQELLGVGGEPIAPLRPEDAPGARLVPPTPDRPGAWSGPYQAGAVWAVLEGAGTVEVNGRAIPVDGPACYPLVEHPHHSAGVLDLRPGDGVTCHAVQFEPGLAP